MLTPWWLIKLTNVVRSSRGVQLSPVPVPASVQTRAWRCRDILQAGAMGSDWPIAPFDPRRTLAAAQLRRPADRPDVDPVRPDQALTAQQALHGYTTAPALTANAGHLNGRIAPGYRADLTAFAANPLHTPAADLPAVPVTYTVVDGTIRHRTS
jgi:predicted amidohydrolase YtcJ